MENDKTSQNDMPHNLLQNAQGLSPESDTYGKSRVQNLDPETMRHYKLVLNKVSEIETLRIVGCLEEIESHTKELQ